MNENELVKLLESVIGKSESTSALLIRRSGNLVTIASRSADSEMTATYRINERSRTARSAVRDALVNILVPYEEELKCLDLNNQ